MTERPLRGRLFRAPPPVLVSIPVGSPAGSRTASPATAPSATTSYRLGCTKLTEAKYRRSLTGSESQECGALRLHPAGQKSARLVTP